MRRSLLSLLLVICALTQAKTQVKLQRTPPNEVLAVSSRCEKDHPADAEAQFMRLVNQYQTSGDKAAELDAWIWLAKYMAPLDPTRSKIEGYYEHIVPLTIDLHKEQATYDARHYLADIHLNQKKLDQSETELLRLVTDFPAPKYQLYSYDLLTAVYLQKSQLNKALDYGLKTQRLMQETGDSASAITFYYRLCQIYATLEDPKNCLEWFKRVYYHQIATHDLKNIGNTVNNIAGLLLDLGKPAEGLRYQADMESRFIPSTTGDKILSLEIKALCYTALKKNDSAEWAYKQLLRIDDREKLTEAVKQHLYSSIGDYYYKMRKYEQARKYILLALNRVKDLVSEDKQNVRMQLYKVDSALGDYKSAMLISQEYANANDSIFSVAKRKQIEELAVAYKTEQKDKDLKISQDSIKLEQASLQRTKNTRDWIIAGLSMFFIISALLFRQTRLRKKNNAIITHKNQLLEHLLAEKDWLLKEVHHRVKNNLHTVICLLESQAAYLENDALKAIENSQHRIYAMSLIHQKLYQSEDVKTIDMSLYLTEFIQYLTDSMGSPDNVYIHMNIQSLKLGVSQAITVGLIANEAVTNSFKYAFPDKRRGEIFISLSRHEKEIELVLKDTGIGMPPGFAESETDSLGMELIKGLAGDLSGSVQFETQNGTKITLTFPTDPLLTY